MVNVYFETSSTAELVARFADEETYMECLASLEKLAKQRRMEVSESVTSQSKEMGEALETIWGALDRYMADLYEWADDREIYAEEFRNIEAAFKYIKDAEGEIE